MKITNFLIVAFALSIAGCSEKEPAAPEEAPVVETSTVVIVDERDAEFIEHMHRHADYLDDLNLALADGDLEAAMTPAYWLAGHDAVEGIPADWLPYVEGMRAAARQVEQAPDLDAARVASEMITVQCQSCHAAAGLLDE